MDDERVATIALNLIPGIGGFAVKQLISFTGSASDVFQQKKVSIEKIPQIGQFISESIKLHRKEAFILAEEQIKHSEKEGSSILLYKDSDFPQRLKNAYDSPAMLYIKGTPPLNTSKVISIVGTRRATQYGKERVSEIISGLLPHHCLIVSGLAYGIDIEAHSMALKHNLPTVAVLASSLDVIYPQLHKKYVREMIVNQGGIISEYKYKTKLDPKRFPARNRIIAGMADATIVVEGAKKGGALITAHIANSYNRDVFAIPGRVGDPYSEGCNHLIKNHKAHLLESVKDIEYIMGWDQSKENFNTLQYSMEFPELDRNEKIVVDILKKEAKPVLFDNLSWLSEIPVNKLASLLLNLEFRGIINSLPGKLYQLKTTYG